MTTNPLQALIDEYELWLETNDDDGDLLDVEGDAEDVIAYLTNEIEQLAAVISNHQSRIDWLRGFCMRWERAEGDAQQTPAQRLARRFAEVVQRVMEDDELAWLRVENARRARKGIPFDPLHDICDPNELMLTAAQELSIPIWDDKDEHFRPETSALMDEAFELARAAHYDPDNI